MSRFTSFAEEGFQGENPLSLVARKLAQPGTLASILNTAGSLLPQYALFLHAAGAIAEQVDAARIADSLAHLSPDDLKRLAALLPKE